MARVSTTNQHDWLGIRITFDNGQKANLTWSRNGEKVDLSPPDRSASEQLSIIVLETLQRLKSANGANPVAYKFKDLGGVVAEMARVAEGASTLEGYIAAVKPALDVTGERPRARGAENAPASTVATLQKARGWVLKATFPNGDKVELKINASSIGLLIDPPLPSAFKELSGLIFGLKQVGSMDDEAIGALARDAATDAADIGSWVDAIRARVAPAAAPGR